MAARLRYALPSGADRAVMMAWRQLCLSALFMMMSNTALAERWVAYTIDPKATRIRFHWTYMGMLSPAGQFSNAVGTIVCDLDKPDSARVDVRIPVRTLKTFMPLIDSTLLGSGDYFQPEQYPIMRFRSTEIMHLDKEKREFSLVGELTVNGISRPVILSAKVPTANQGNPLSSGALSATTSFRRSDFGMNKMLGIVGDEMRVILQVRAQEAPTVASQ